MKRKSAHEPKARVMNAADVRDDASRIADVLCPNRKVEVLKKRLRKNRPMKTVSIRFPEDVIEDLKRVASLRGFSGYQPLVRAYVGQGLRVDLERDE